MKKKFWLILLALVATLCLCFGLSACSFFGTIGSVDQGEQQGGSQGGEQQGGGQGGEQQGGSQGGEQQGGSQGGEQQGGSQGGGQQGGGQGGGSGTTPSHTEEWAKNESGHWHVVAGEKEGFAAHTYKDGKCTECNYEHEVHIYGVYVGTESGHSQNCTICGKVLTVTEQHRYKNGKCTTCQYEHASHAFVYSEKTETKHTGACPVCGKTVTKAHIYENGKCTTCEYEHARHTFKYSEKTETEHTGTCSVCGKTVTEAHNYENGVCEDCAYEHVNHAFEYSNKTETEHTGTCSVCGKVVTEAHNYENGVCEDCEYEHTSHTFIYSNKTETEHTGMCSVCGKTVSEAHAYEKGICAECNYVHQNHNYGTDNTCSVCGAGFYTKSADGTKIYLGSYPQTEVTDENDSDKSLRNSLNMAAGSVPAAGNAGKWTDYGYYIEGAVTEYMWYIDVEYQGSRYRGVYFTSYRPSFTTTSSSADNSNQDENGYETNTVYWFKYEPIEWRILEEKDGKAFLMANIILDGQQYYHTDSGTRTVDGKTVYPSDYKESDIRAWLNGAFYETAFDAVAKQIIETTTVDNSAATTGWNGNPYVCENTQDKVFLLSFQEVLNTSYGFSPSVSTRDTARQLKSTDYAKAQGVLVYRDVSRYRGNDWWYLRSPGSDVYSWDVMYDGDASHGGVGNLISGGVVPALWIKL